MSSQAKHTLLSAFERFAATVTTDDQRVFNDTKLKDVRDEAMQIERQLRARRTQRNMARLEPFLRGVEHYSKVVEVLCNGTPFLPWIWAPVKLMLMVTVDSISAFEKLIEAYGKIADMMPRLDRLESALHDDFNFQNVLALVYSDIIEFHRRAYKFVRRKSWAVFFGSMWAGFESRFNSILQSLAYHTELLDKEAAAADISDAVRRHKEDSEKWEQQEREWEALKVRAVLSWLGTTDTLPADTLERYLQDCLPGSCDWFVQHRKTQLWLEDSSKNALLWLYGKPGAGKSMICSSLIQHIDPTACLVLYYFCSFVDHTSDGHSRLLRSLVSQIIHVHQDLAIYVHDVYFRSHPVPSKKALLNLLLDLLRGLGSVRIVIDGLDEWTTRDQNDLLRDLAQMLSTNKSAHVCKILVASRDTLDVTRILRKKGSAAVTVSLSTGDEELEVARSIGLYVDNKLSDLPEHFTDLDPDASIMTEVKSTLLRKSHGMFLWVRLVLDSLDAVYSPGELRAIVNDLPTDLEKLYGNIYERMCNVHGAHSHGGVARIISWICFAQRPLHKHELLQALSVPRWGIGSDDAQSIPVASILDHCKPFVEERADATIVLVHFSVKEFFLKFNGLHFVTPLEAELDLSSVCVVVLIRGLGLLRPGLPLASHARVASGSYRLLPYAMKFWIEHCTLYTSNGGTLSAKIPLAHHLMRLHEAHRLLLGSLNRPSSFVIEGLQDPDLQNYAHLSAYTLMKEVLRIRRLASENGCENGPDVETFAIQNDQTLFTTLASEFEDSVLYLLSKSEVVGIHTTLLQTFQDSYRSTAFRCRYPQCDMSCPGFASQQLRTQHETMHFQRVYCKVPTCQYYRIGFAKKAALTTHVRNFHADATALPIPTTVRRLRGAVDGSTIMMSRVVSSQASQDRLALRQMQTLAAPQPGMPPDDQHRANLPQQLIPGSPSSNNGIVEWAADEYIKQFMDTSNQSSSQQLPPHFATQPLFDQKLLPESLGTHQQSSNTSTSIYGPNAAATAGAVDILRAREEVPLPLPPPRHIDDLRPGQDPGWKWGNTSSLRTKSDLLNIDQFLEQLQSTVYENSNQAAAAGVQQAGAHYAQYRSSHSPPGLYPKQAHGFGVRVGESAHQLQTQQMQAPLPPSMPVVTPVARPAPDTSTHALQDYQMQLMLQEQRSKKALLLERSIPDLEEEGRNASRERQTLAEVRRDIENGRLELGGAPSESRVEQKPSTESLAMQSANRLRWDDQLWNTSEQQPRAVDFQDVQSSPQPRPEQVTEHPLEPVLTQPYSALPDYQKQLMLLEHQNVRRLQAEIVRKELQGLDASSERRRVVQTLEYLENKSQREEAAMKSNGRTELQDVHSLPTPHQVAHNPAASDPPQSLSSSTMHSPAWMDDQGKLSLQERDDMISKQQQLVYQMEKHDPNYIYEREKLGTMYRMQLEMTMRSDYRVEDSQPLLHASAPSPHTSGPTSVVTIQDHEESQGTEREGRMAPAIYRERNPDVWSRKVDTAADSFSLRSTSHGMASESSVRGKQKALGASPPDQPQAPQDQDHRFKLLILAHQNEERQRKLIEDMEQRGLDTAQEHQILTLAIESRKTRQSQWKESLPRSELHPSDHGGDARSTSRANHQSLSVSGRRSAAGHPLSFDTTHTPNAVSPPAQSPLQLLTDYQTQQRMVHQRNNILALKNRITMDDHLGENTSDDREHFGKFVRHLENDMSQAELSWHPQTGELIPVDLDTLYETPEWAVAPPLMRRG